jgi:hypothetical protein
MNPTPIRAIVCLVAACTLTSFEAPRAQTPYPEPQREALIQALEALIATGEPGQNTHDEGEWLQLAVDDAIRRGDTEVERIAIRAASPLTARMTAPVRSTDTLPSLELNAHTVLKLARPRAYSARVYASVDGSQFVKVLELVSGKGGGVRIDTRLGTAAAQPGFHQVRVRAHLTFGGRTETPWTEVRDLPPLFYALYDMGAASPADARRFVYGPAATPARELDPLLGDEPFGVWLTDVLSKRGASTDPLHWMSQYCSERTAEAGSRPDPTAVCSVVYFQVRGHIGQIWFRTGDVHVSDDGVAWIPLAPPRFEGLVIQGSGPESQRLSVLPLLIDTDPASRPTGDVAIAPDDIVITPGTPAPGAPAAVTVTVRNQGQADLHKVAVFVAFGTSATAGTSRRFVVDVPAQNSVEITLDVVFPQGFGFLMAQAMQIGEHAPHDSWTPDPTPEDACAFRIVNPRAAPPRYLESLGGDTSGCRWK